MSVVAAPESPHERSRRHFFSHPAHWLAMGLGSGLLRPGPGTWGTAMAWFLFRLLAPEGVREVGTSLVLLAAALAVGTWAAHRSSAMIGEADASTIVIDEMVAFWLVLVLLPPGGQLLARQALAFALFRLFDITKPPPIGAIDRRWKNAIGVMADDLVAALYTLLVMAVGARLA